MSGRTVRVAKHLKTRLGSSFTVRISALNNFVIVLNSFICKILKYKAGIILKFKVVYITTGTLVMYCYSCDLRRAIITVVIN